MNVIVSNQSSKDLTALDIDVIKSVTGEYSVDELISMFKTFFYEKIIIDVTAIKEYRNTNNVERLAMGLGAEKIILLLTDELCSSNYLSALIDVGLYNFTNNINAIKRLIAKPNTYDDVKQLQELNASSNETSDSSSHYSSIKKVIGFQNITKSAGATTLIYMLFKELKKYYNNGVYALELNKKDFSYFNSKDMISISEGELESKLDQLSNANVVLVDLNGSKKDSLCSETIYLLEPSTIKLNQLIRNNQNVFEKLKGKKVVLNKSMLSNKDVTEFEYEANSKMFYNIPSLNDREKNSVLNDFLSRLGIYDETNRDSEDGNKLFGIFRH